MAEISLRAKTLDNYIFLLQEPWINNTGAISGLDGGGKCYAGSKTKARACIYAHKDINLWISQELSDRDITTCIWQDPTSKKNTYIISGYLDITTRTIPTKLKDTLQQCRSLNEEAIISLDSNAHSGLWGSPENNRRGDRLEEFILANELVVMNNGSLPTFQTVRASSIIDVTLATHIASTKLSGWRVCPDDMFSDHKLIKMSLSHLNPVPAFSRCLNKTDWPLFTSIVDGELETHEAHSVPALWSNDTIEGQLAKLEQTMEAALELTCPKRKKKPILILQIGGAQS